MAAEILLVDDDPDLLKLIGMRLSAAGYRVRSAESGESALAQIAVARPAVVVTDLRMPGIVPCAVRIITGSVGCCALICSKSCMPSIPGMRKSVTTTAGLATAICASADSPLSAERTR